MDHRERELGGVDRIFLAQDRGQWRAVVSTVMDVAFHNVLGNFSTSERLAASQEGLRSV
jgi:hypothetical protein